MFRHGDDFSDAAGNRVRADARVQAHQDRTARHERRAGQAVGALIQTQYRTSSGCRPAKRFRESAAGQPATQGASL